MRRLLLIAVVTLAVATAAFAASSPTGVYAATVKGKTPAALNGAWTIAIATNGDFTISKTGLGLLVKGRVVIAGKKITFGRESGPAACKGSQATGTYTWSLAGKKLTLKPVKDTCSGRRAVLTSPLTKIK